MIVVDAHIEADAAIAVEAGGDIAVAVAARQRVLQRYPVLEPDDDINAWRRPDLDRTAVVP